MNIDYDNEINPLIQKEELKWLPWIGLNYEALKTLFIGDSNYEDGGNVDEKVNWTRDFIFDQGFNKELSKNGNSRLLRSVEKTFLNEYAYDINKRKLLWSSVAYLNLSQRAVKVEDGIYDRPTGEDFQKGWRVMLKVLLILKPKCCIKFGIAGDGIFINEINQNTDWDFLESPEIIKNNELGIYERCYKISHTTGYELIVIFINHPSGSRGYKTAGWRSFIFRNLTEMEPYFRK
ncbi:MAG: hypothetical protein IPM51_10585 [Sphingobacteriaceae bacterium]|nr:hypothetical protein [Sphingobacteriaceae bacterium]